LHAPKRQRRAGDSRSLDQRSTAPAPRWRDVAAEGGELFGRLRTRYQMPELSSLPHGDGHPVLVLPGLLSADWMTRGFRGVLTALGYQVEGWGAGINLGPTESAWRITAERLLTVAAGSGRQVSLVGHSLGGVLGRALAHEHPALVRRVITVCSPFHPPVTSPLEPLYRMLLRWHVDQDFLLSRIAEPPPVATTAIYTPRDRIVAWTSCVDVPGSGRENVSIDGAHSTMLGNPSVIQVIADRLARP
jgi:pimeloyl-ACP methyl ester carboxylesterase